MSTEKPENARGGDFSAEDDLEAQVAFENAATGEFERLVKRLKEEEKKRKEALGDSQSK